MKKLIMLLVLLASSAGASIDFKGTADIVGLSGQVIDTNALNTYQIADSVRIITTFQGKPCLDAWYNAGDAEADSTAGILTWYDAVGDIDADSGVGLYTVTAMFYDASNGTYTNRYLQFYLGIQSVNMASASNDALDLTTDICNILADSNIATIDVNIVSVSDDAINLVSDVTGALADSNIATIDVNIASVSDDALNLVSDVTGALADSNIATIDVNVASVTSDAINLVDDVTGTLPDSNIATIAVATDSLSTNALHDLFTYDLAQYADSAATRFGHLAESGLDTSKFGYAEDVWMNIDTAPFDTSNVLDWMEAKIGTTAATDTTKIKTLVENNPLLFRDVAMVNSDSSSAANLETMLNGTGGGTLSLGRIAVSGANSTNGSFAITNSSGPAIIASGTTAGAVYKASAGTGVIDSGTVNALALVAGTGDAINGTSTSGDGIDVAAGTNGTGLKATGNGVGAGITGQGGSNGHGAYFVGVGTGSGLYAIGGVTSGHGIAGIGSTSGDGMRLAGGLSDGDALQLSPDPSPSTPGAAMYIRGELDSANFASGTFDSAHFTDKFFTNAQGAASGLDSTKVWGAAKQALTQGDFIWRANQFIIKTDGAANDTGAFAVYNSGPSTSDHAVSLAGNAGNGLYQFSTSNSAVEYSTPSDQPTAWHRNSGNGEAQKFTAVGNNAVEITSSVSTAGVASLEISATGEGVATRIYADTGDALLLQVANNAVAGTNNALQIEGRSYLHNRGSAPYRLEDAMLIEAQRSGRALYLLSDSSTAFRISGDSGIVILADSATAGIIGGLDTLLAGGGSGSETDTTTMKVMFANNPDLVGADTATMKTMASNNPALFYGPSGTGAGTGSYSVVIYALDTVGADAALELTKITAQDASGGVAGYDHTDGTGKVTLALDAGTYTILARRPGYVFDQPSLLVSGNIDSTAVLGYTDAAGYVVGVLNVGSGIPNAYGQMMPRTGAKMTLQLIGEQNLHDTTWAYFPRVQEDYPDSTTGEVSFYMIPNSLLTPAGSYYILTASVHDGHSSMDAIVRKFVVDTSSTAINILNTTEVW